MSPVGMTAVRAELGGHPLLQLAYRIYRWREAESPTLLGAVDITQTFYLDHDLPLFSDQYYYCIATVLEGKIDDVPTLMESKNSSVISVRSKQKYQVSVLGGSEGLARVEVAVYADGRWRRKEFAVTPGSRIGVAGVPREESEPDFDTGLTVLDIEVREETAEASIDRPIFLPDGRREVNPSTGLPTFRSMTEPVHSQIVELECLDHAQEVTRISSSPRSLHPRVVDDPGEGNR
jgi:hypothetical protein